MPTDSPTEPQPLEEQLFAQIPRNWCDSLLTGPDGIGQPPFDCPAIERLLNAIRERISSVLRASGSPAATLEVEHAHEMLDGARVPRNGQIDGSELLFRILNLIGSGPPAAKEPDIEMLRTVWEHGIKVAVSYCDNVGHLQGNTGGQADRHFERLMASLSARPSVPAHIPLPEFHPSEPSTSGVTTTRGVTFDPTSNVVPIEQAGYVASVPASEGQEKP